jgi:predicted DNA-binding transcriptional regulator AlpA
LPPYIPESILKDSYRRPGLRYAEWQPCYPLTRLIRQGKIEGAQKDKRGRWIINRIWDYENKYSVRQISTMCGYKTTKSIYDQVNNDTIPYRTDSKGQIYFLENEIIKWMQINKNIPHSKPTISILDIFKQLKGLAKLKDFADKILDDNADPESIIKLFKEKISLSFDNDFWLLRIELEEFLTKNHLYINKYDYAPEKNREGLE